MRKNSCHCAARDSTDEGGKTLCVDDSEALKSVLQDNPQGVRPTR